MRVYLEMSAIKISFLQVNVSVPNKVNPSHATTTRRLQEIFTNKPITYGKYMKKPK